MADITTIVQKSDEVACKFEFSRSKQGLRLSVQIHPMIEDMLSDWGRNETEDVAVIARDWVPALGESLKVWSLFKDPGRMMFDGGTYSMHTPGKRLVDENGVVNLSILRLVGASRGGVTFDVVGVYTPRQIRDQAEKIKQASRQFYIDFLKPIHLNVTISTQEVRV